MNWFFEFSVDIQAPKEKVWQAMLEDATYREWTSPFQEGSYAITDWKEGTKTLFLGPDGSGMVSRIAVHRPNEFLSIEHLGVVRNGVEDTESESVKAWAGAFENYRLTETAGHSILKIAVDSNEEMTPYFEKTWPIALSKLKEIAETSAAGC